MSDFLLCSNESKSSLNSILNQPEPIEVLKKSKAQGQCFFQTTRPLRQEGEYLNRRKGLELIVLASCIEESQPWAQIGCYRRHWYQNWPVLASKTRCYRQNWY